MSETVALIPTNQRNDLLVPLVRELLDQNELYRLLVMDNSNHQTAKHHLPKDERLVIADARAMSIYRMWNEGWDWALNLAPQVNLAILNDDILIPQQFLSRMVLALRSDPKWWLVYPDYRCRVADDLLCDEAPKMTHGTYHHGGMSGWAFMVRAEVRRAGLPRIDEQFEWWCGDDDLAKQIENMGGQQGCIGGMPVDHIGEASAQHNYDAQLAKGQDIRRFIEKYGEW